MVSCLTFWTLCLSNPIKCWGIFYTGITVGFGSPNVTVQESTMTFMMCLVVQGETNMDILATITAVDGSAIQGEGKYSVPFLCMESIQGLLHYPHENCQQL